MATDKELSDFLKSVEKRAWKRAVYAVRDDDAALDIVQDTMIRLSEKYADRPAAELPLLFQRILSNATMAATMARQWLLFTAWRGGKRIAASLIAIDPERKTAFGRYWGSVEHVNCLHFDACYYQPLEWCIANGYRRFEGGAQGEHKMARGLLPVQTWSAHWLAHPQFARAIDDFVAREGAGVESYLDELAERRPFKAAEGGG